VSNILTVKSELQQMRDHRLRPVPVLKVDHALQALSTSKPEPLLLSLMDWPTYRTLRCGQCQHVSP
jgi:hypothetical protein